MASNARLFEASVFRLMLLFAFALCYISDVSESFNVEWRNAVKFHGPSQSLFGFSIAQHKENGKSWMVIGAPEAADMSGKHTKDYRGGAVYYCDTDRNDSCRLITFHDSGGFAPGTIDNRTRQWLGATVRSSGEDGKILACAPRYYWFKSVNNAQAVRDPVGTCYLAYSQFQESDEYSPCRTKGTQGYARQGSCQVGFGAAITKDANRIYLGAVGSFYWQGEAFTMHTNFKLPFTDDQKWLFNEETGQLISLSKYNRPELMSSKEGSLTEDDSYMGYSVETINYYGTNISGAVVGTPRGDMLNGKIQILTWNLTNVKNITGEQIGSYFGYSLAVADINGDGSQDIIVGAPMFSNYSSSKNEYEKGRVYIFYQDLKPCGFLDFACWDTKFDRYQIIDGESSKSRFGLSVTALGDINKDGFEDFAVGAPYEGTIGGCMKSSVTGAVYIYHGSKNGVRRQPSQKISAEQISQLSQSALTTFGFSLSGGIDMDNNQYPDLAVGAYESDIVYLFRSRPVINIDATLQFKSSNKVIDIDSQPNCKLNSSGSFGHCVKLQMCLRYTDTGVAETVDLQVSISLDVKKSQNPRMFFTHNEGTRDYHMNIGLQRGAGEVCREMVTYVVPSNPNLDKLTPLEAEMSYKLNEPLYSYDGELRPILNMDDETPLRRQDAMFFKNNCGEDNVCIPELHMRVTPNVQQFILGSDHLIFNVSVANKGEDSFGSVFKMHIPAGVHYSKFEHFAKDNSYVQCFPPKTNEINITINCNIGNPLPANKNVNFSVILQPKSKVVESEFDFSFEVNSSIAQVAALSNTTAHFRIPIFENATLKIDGESKPKEVNYNSSQYDYDEIKTDGDAGPFLRHTYTIKNLGPSDMSEAKVVFTWPSKTSAGDDLLYLLSAPVMTGNIQCQTLSKDNNYNYKHLKLMRVNKDEIEEGKGATMAHSKEEKPYKPGQGNWSGSINNINKGSTSWEKQKGESSSEKVSGSSTIRQTNKTTIYKESNQQTGSNTYYPGGSYQGSNQQTGENAHQMGSFHQTGSSYQGGSQQTGTSIQQVGGSYQGGSSYQEGGSIFQGGVSNTHQTGSSDSIYHSGGSQQSGGIRPTGGSGQFITGVLEFGGHQQGGESVYKNGGSHQFQTSEVNVHQQNQHHQGGYISQGSQQKHGGGYASVEGQYGGSQHSNGADGYQGGYVQTIVPSGKNYSSVHEFESSYSKNTKFGEKGPVTFVQSQWTKNNNGAITNGSFSTSRPGYIENGHFFGSQNVNEQTASGGSWSNAHNVGGGKMISRQQFDQNGNILTTYDEGTQRLMPEIKTDGSESETVHHYRFENSELLKPTITPDGRKVYEPARPYFSGNTEQINQRIAEENQKMGHRPTVRNEEYNDEDEEEKSRNRQKRQSFNGHDEHFCTKDTCATIECTIKTLPKDHEVTVTFRSLVWMKTIKKIALGKPVQVGSYAVVNHTKLTTMSAEILTNVTSLDYDSKSSPDVIPLWIVVTSACLGALILMALIYLLYRCGFFKRNRPQPLPERQPLNRNGNYHMGDEAL